jgi:hypothetical protein
VQLYQDFSLMPPCRDSTELHTLLPRGRTTRHAYRAHSMGRNAADSRLDARIRAAHAASHRSDHARHSQEQARHQAKLDRCWWRCGRHRKNVEINAQRAQASLLEANIADAHSLHGHEMAGNHDDTKLFHNMKSMGGHRSSGGQGYRGYEPPYHQDTYDRGDEEGESPGDS